jgi:prepilin-type N-terminal cleavage/methylation domain-containing protein
MKNGKSQTWTRGDKTMKKPSRLINRRGFTIIETMMAVMILSLACVTGSQLLLRTTQRVTQANMTKKAATLGEMVLEKYNSVATQNYTLLGNTNVTKESAKDFFQTADNMGYDGLTITTLASYSTNKSSCTLTTKVEWTAGGQQKSLVFTKLFSETMPVAGGGALQIWAKIPCGSYTSTNDIIAYCPGLQGLSISGPASNPGGVIQGVTDSQGGVVLQGLMLGDSIPITVGSVAPTDYTVPLGAGFRQGYYAVNNGQYVYSMVYNNPISATSLKMLPITNFRAAGIISGTLTNQTSGGPVSGLQVSLQSGARAAFGNNYLQAGTNFQPTTITDAGGHYAFSNVVTDSVVGLSVDGLAGSDPWIALSSPSYVQGYAGAAPYSVATSQWPSSIPPIVT